MNTVRTWQTNTDSSEATEKIAERLGQNCTGGEVFSLVSDLGGGKTTFTRGLAKGIDSADHVSSPTFKISNIYKGKNLTLYHYDFYRLQQDELIALELADALEDPLGVTVIEWASQVPKSVPPSAITVSLLAGPNENSRKLVLTNAPPQLMKGLE